MFTFKEIDVMRSALVKWEGPAPGTDGEHQSECMLVRARLIDRLEDILNEKYHMDNMIIERCMEVAKSEYYMDKMVIEQCMKVVKLEGGGHE